MNDRLVVQDGFLKPSNTPEAPRVRKWSRSVAVAVTVTFMSLTMSHQGRILPKIRGRMLAARMIPGWKWEVGCSRFPIVLPKPHVLSQAASLVVLDTLFPEGTQNRRNHLDHQRLWDLHPPTSPSSRRGTDPFSRQGER